MTDLIIDASIAAVVCDGSSSEVASLFDARENSGYRNWLYVGQKMEILELLCANTKERRKLDPAQVAREKLASIQQRFLWLAALAEDGDTLNDSDPTAAALAQAARRLGNKARVLTNNVSRLARGAPFIDLQTACDESVAESAIPFIDLRAQQDHIRPSLERSIHRVLHHGVYVSGPEILEIERELADYVGVEHCVCVSSGTDALLIALLALGIGVGDEVVTTPFSFIATCEVISLIGAKPIFVDVDLRTGNLDPNRVEERITGRTRAIIPVSLYGQTADMSRINEIAATHQLPVIEDAAQSFGALHQGRRSCGLSTIGCTSFFPAKPLGAYGDAGACFTADPEIARVMRELLDHGQDQGYRHVRIGINARMDSLQAAVLLSKFTIFEQELEERQVVAQRYGSLMKSLERDNKLTLPYVAKGNCSVWAQYTIRVEGRDHLQKKLANVGIPSAVHYPRSLPDQPALYHVTSEYPHSEMLARTVLSLPMHPYLSPTDQDRIVNSLRAALS